MGKLKSDRIIEFIAIRCKQLRKENNLTQLDVVNDTGIAISRVESGRMDITVSTVQKLADYYGVDLSEFFRADLVQQFNEQFI